MRDASSEDLKFFVVVARSAGLTAAAREIGTLVSSVSKRLSHIEDRLGARLVRRTTRQLASTSEGERYARSRVDRVPTHRTRGLPVATE
jgi:LysR family transcriptional activator of dmlA